MMFWQSSSSESELLSSSPEHTSWAHFFFFEVASHFFSLKLPHIFFSSKPPHIFFSSKLPHPGVNLNFDWSTIKLRTEKTQLESPHYPSNLKFAYVVNRMHKFIWAHAGALARPQMKALHTGNRTCKRLAHVVVQKCHILQNVWHLVHATL